MSTPQTARDLQRITPEQLTEIRIALQVGATELRFSISDALLSGNAASAGMLATLIARNERAQYHAWGLSWPCYPETQNDSRKSDDDGGRTRIGNTPEDEDEDEQEEEEN